jgi:hypothetical protein
MFEELSEAACTSHQSLPAIRVICNDLKSLKYTLESLAARCDDLIRDVSPWPSLNCLHLVAFGTGATTDHFNFAVSLTHKKPFN